MEEWVPLDDYPGYSASTEGRIRNDKRKTHNTLRISRSDDKRPYVGLWVNGAQVKRSLPLLICKTFKDQPNSNFDTPIHLDGNVMNCRADNLEWRPRWFANKFSEQFHQDLGDAGPIRNVDTGEVYESVWQVVHERGLLYIDVVAAIVNRTYVFPIFQFFEWVE